jgi:hypothetical protein
MKTASFSPIDKKARLDQRSQNMLRSLDGGNRHGPPHRRQ